MMNRSSILGRWKRVSANEGGWSDLVALGSSKILRSSYLFFILVPLVVALIDQMSKIFGIEFVISYRWLMLFWAAVFASIANVIYSLFCPRFIKLAPSYKDYMSGGYQGWDLNLFLRSAYHGHLGQEPEDENVMLHKIFELGQFKLGWKSLAIPDSHVERIVNYLRGGVDRSTSNSTIQESAVAYQFVRGVIDLKYPRTRQLCRSLYFVSFALVGIIAVQNIYWVLLYTFYT